MKNTFYVTTPIYYVNDIPHIGHAYTTIAADVLARYHRQNGQAVFFLTGTDEHGQKISEAAAKVGKPEQQFVDEISVRFKHAWEKLNIQYDGFVRTTDAQHVQAVQSVFKQLQASGDVYLGHYEGWYCTPDETFWTDTQLVEGKCPQCGREVHLLKEESYFFKLSKYQDKLLAHIQANPEFIQPESRRNEVIKFIEQGLKDLSITRTSFTWGVPVPGAEKHVVYVWFDALINYISAIGYGTDEVQFKKYWPASAHVMGKEIVRFHAVIWPAMLMALDIPLPEVVFGHGWWTVEGQKMSKSLGNVVDPLKLAEEFGVDATRYFLLREVPFGNDGDFSLQHFKQRFNTDLANDIGNLFSRALNMCDKYFQAVQPALVPEALADKDKELLNMVQALAGQVDKAMYALAFSVALDHIWAVISTANKYIEVSAPWTLAKENKTAELANAIHVLVEVLKTLTVFVAPFMPVTAEKMTAQVALLKKGEPLFPRLELSK